MFAGLTKRASVVTEGELVRGRREREIGADPGGSSGSGSDAPETPDKGEQGYTVLVKKRPVFNTQGTRHGQLIGILKFCPDPERISGPRGDRQHPVRF